MAKNIPSKCTQKENKSHYCNNGQGWIQGKKYVLKEGKEMWL